MVFERVLICLTGLVYVSTTFVYGQNFQSPVHDFDLHPLPNHDHDVEADDVFWHSYWNQIGDISENPVISEFKGIIDSEKSQRGDITLGGDGGNLLGHLLTGLDSLTDTDGILKALQIYGHEYYNQLMFWAWLHKVSRSMYEKAMHAIVVSDKLESQMHHTESVDRSADKALLLKLFKFMVDHYHGSSWSKLVKTLTSSAPFLRQMAAQNAATPNYPDSLNAAFDKYSANDNSGGLDLAGVNQMAQDIDASNHPPFN